MYYNSVTKSHKISQKTASVTDQKNVNQPQKQRGDTSADNVVATEGHYEALNTSTSKSENANQINTYAKLQ